MVSARQAVAAILTVARHTAGHTHSSRVFAAGLACALALCATWSAHAVAQQVQPQIQAQDPAQTQTQARAQPTKTKKTKKAKTIKLAQAQTQAQGQAQAQTQAQGQTPSPSASTAGSGQTDQLQEVTVTGTRIKRKDYESNSPLVTIDASQLEQRSGLNIESYLNQLPQYNPAETPTTEAEDVQPSAINTVGASTISLRGLGPNRSLVLVDGHRTTPVNALMVTDINTIPSGMIDRIETISGGASAVYGADAMGGVTNFILKKSFQGLQLDVQDGITQAGDGNEMRLNALMGTRFADGDGNIIMGAEYYKRNAALDANRDFFTDAWTDPNALSSNAFFINGYNAYAPQYALPSAAALQAVFPARYAAGGQAAGPYGGLFSQYYFNPNGSLFIGNTSFGTNNGFLNTANYQGPTSGDGFGLENCYDANSGNVFGVTPVPPEGQCLKWNNPTALLSLPQARYSFYGKGTFDFTDKIQFFTNVRFAGSQTDTVLATPTSGINGWSASVPFNPTTDSPINPSLFTFTTVAPPAGSPAGTPPTYVSSVSQATLNAIAAAFSSGNPGAYANPNYISIGTKGAQHPVPWQLAMMLMTRSIQGNPAAASLPQSLGGPVTCNSSLSPALCTPAAYSWDLSYYPGLDAAPQRSTTDTDTSWQIETGLDFPVGVGDFQLGDWTGELYYSRGQTQTYQQAYGNDSLARWQAIVDSPGYGEGQTFQGNYASVNPNFGNSVPATCASGLYGAIFNDTAPSADCQNAVSATLQTMTQIEQDIVEANFQGTVVHDWAGDISAAVGYQSRRDSAIFTPDGLQSTSSFLDETVGLYPLGSLNAETIARDGYAELFVPLLNDPDRTLMKTLNLDVGGRYSTYDDAPNATTFKVNLDAKLIDSVRFRGGFNRATRAPNLGELYLNEQEYFGGAALYGDPCSVQSRASFGAGNAAPDQSSSAGTPQKTYNANGAAGAESTYLICLAQMGALNTNGTPNTSALGYSYYTGTNQSTAAGDAGFAWLNEIGNSNLQSETADTWTAGAVLSNLTDAAWLRALTMTLDWWQIGIRNAIAFDSPDYANYLCYGTTIVTTYAEAVAQANSPACLNVPRSTTNGGGLTQLLQFDNLGTIHTSGVDFGLNWFVQFSDIGLGFLPGGFAYNSQDTLLLNYYTKASPLAFDVNTNWKDSLGPTLYGTNGGAYGYRLYQTFSWVMPSFSVNVNWEFLPSVNTVSHASTAAIEAYDASLPAGSQQVLGYTPDNTIAAAHYNKIDLSFSWNITKTLQLRGGIDNIFNAQPAITGATTPFKSGVDYCAGKPQGCAEPGAYTLANDGAGITNVGFYDVLGRTFFLGFKAQF